MAKQREAFTLIEMVLVCAVLALLGAIIVPSLENFHSDARVLAAADQVKALLAQTRSRAVEEGRPYRFEIVDATHCRIAPDTGDAPGAGGDSDTPPEDVALDNVEMGSSKSGDDSSDNAGGNARIVFFPNGTAREDAEIRLTTKGARPATIQVRALTGTTTVVRPKENAP